MTDNRNTRAKKSGKKTNRRVPPSDVGARQRDLTIKVQTARGRKLESTLWLQRQLKRPYVKTAPRRTGFGRTCSLQILELVRKNTAFWCPVHGELSILGARRVAGVRWRSPRVQCTGEKTGQAHRHLSLRRPARGSEPMRDRDPPAMDFLED